jgi:AcrR family transcriptional regulator
MAAGRPRTFDLDEALDRAMVVFWKHGYEGATIPELTEAMGINRPSMYAAFGNKESLFRKALERYANGPASYVVKALEELTARAVAERLLKDGIAVVTDPKKPGGCLAVQGALTCAAGNDEARQNSVAMRVAGEEQVRMRFERAKKEGDLPDDVEPADLAKYVVSLMHGLAIQAASGATRKQLQRVADLAMKCWPTK